MGAYDCDCIENILSARRDRDCAEKPSKHVGFIHGALADSYEKQARGHGYAKGDVTAGDLYQHYKGGIYEILAEAKHTETQEELIAYRSLETGKTWVRPKEMFFGKTDTGLPRFAKVGENGKLTTNNEWLDRVTYYVSESQVDELQSCKCPYCKKYLTTPYMYYFNNYPYCPSCGKKVGGRVEKD